MKLPCVSSTNKTTNDQGTKNAWDSSDRFAAILRYGHCPSGQTILYPDSFRILFYTIWIVSDIYKKTLA